MIFDLIINYRDRPPIVVADEKKQLAELIKAKADPDVISCSYIPPLIYGEGIKELNCRFFQESKSTGTKSQVVCRHLAWRWLLGNNKKETIPRIEKELKDHSFDFLSYDGEQIRFKADRYVILPIAGNHFGTVIFEHFPKQPGELKKFLFSSWSHLMGVILQKKEKSGKNQFVIKFYDPTFTLVYRRIVFNVLEEIKSLKLDDILTRNSLNDYFRINRYGVLCEYGDVGKIHEKKKNQGEVKIVKNGPAVPSKDIFFIACYLVAFNLTEKLKSVLALISKQWSGSQMRVFFASKLNGSSFFNIVLGSGNVESVEIIERTILGLDGVGLKDKVELLAAKSAGYLPGLYSALHVGLIESVKAVYPFVFDLLHSIIIDEIEKKYLDPIFIYHKGVYHKKERGRASREVSGYLFDDVKENATQSDGLFSFDIASKALEILINGEDSKSESSAERVIKMYRYVRSVGEGWLSFWNSNLFNLVDELLRQSLGFANSREISEFFDLLQTKILNKEKKVLAAAIPEAKPVPPIGASAVP